MFLKLLDSYIITPPKNHTHSASDTCCLLFTYSSESEANKTGTSLMYPRDDHVNDCITQRIKKVYKNSFVPFQHVENVTDLGWELLEDWVIFYRSSNEMPRIECITKFSSVDFMT